MPYLPDYNLDPPDEDPICYVCGDKPYASAALDETGCIESPLCEDCGAQCSQCGESLEDAGTLLEDLVVEERFCPSCWASEYFNLPPDDQPTADETKIHKWRG